jgi:hypothetical protein
MDTFESLKRQVEQAQAQVDFVTSAAAAASLLVAIGSLGVLARPPRADTAKRALVAMPDSWLELLAGYEESSDAGLGYIARYVKRHGFLSIHAASRWLEIENQHRREARIRASLQSVAQTTAALAAGFDGRAPGAESLMRRLDNRSARPFSVVDVLERVRESVHFEISETVDRLTEQMQARRP